MDNNEQNNEPYSSDANDIFDKEYKKFEDFLYKSNAKSSIEFNDIKINGKRLFIDGRTSINGKILPFWHLSSQGKDELKYDMFPCENHILKRVCTTKCDFEAEDNFLKEIGRIPCIYRASKLYLFFELIKLYNSNPEDPRIKAWTVNDQNGKNFKIRYIDKEQDIDYIIIMKINYSKGKSDISQYRLITAYPVIMKSYKKRFDREYNNNLD